MPQAATAQRPIGRPRRPNTVDWDAAEAFYLALEERPRKYATVGRQFRISPSMVARKGRQLDWQAKAAAIDQEAAAGARKRIVRTRTDRVAKALQVVDSYLDQLDTALGDKAVEIRISDMPGIVKLAELLEGEATDRVNVGDVQAIVGAVFVAAGRWVVSPLSPVERREGFKAELDAALGGLVVLDQAAA